MARRPVWIELDEPVFGTIEVARSPYPQYLYLPRTGETLRILGARNGGRALLVVGIGRLERLRWRVRGWLRRKRRR